MELLKDLWNFLKQEKNWWLAPMIIVLLLMGILLVVGGGSAIAPLFTHCFNCIVFRKYF